MKRKIALVLALLLTVAMVLRPYDGQALSELEKIDRDLKKLQQEMAKAQKNQKNAERSVKDLTGKQEATKDDIQNLLNKIDGVSKKMQDTTIKIQAAEDKLYETGQQLEDAIRQRDNRMELMDARVRMAYTSGPVSFLDVLLSAKSFTDFLGRMDVVESITSQDRNIAEEKKKYTEEVADMKVQRESELADVQKLYKELQSHQAELRQDEADKEVLMSKIAKQIDDNEEISEEAQEQIKEFAKKVAALQAKKNKIKNYYTGGKLGMPLKSAWRETSPFGYRTHPVTGKRKLHNGLDMAAPKGTPIYAAETGVVMFAQWMSGYGNVIFINHGGGLWTVYGHIMTGGLLVEKDQTVKRGQKIALVGSTGVSTGYHLHFEVRKNSEPVNPKPYLNLK
ncbi:murein hydrolase activator EnvC family protein [Cohnella suwonensis]|uniref:Murein hydrolase activator EnvC family protein n=1 Tax=Cohnella suwonensis TaxID=696072 RepID=A0ABW0LWX8_9BACL